MSPTSSLLLFCPLEIINAPSLSNFTALPVILFLLLITEIFLPIVDDLIVHSVVIFLVCPEFIN